MIDDLSRMERIKIQALIGKFIRDLALKIEGAGNGRKKGGQGNSRANLC